MYVDYDIILINAVEGWGGGGDGGQVVEGYGK